jgi:glycosyltransferase involved in cell wall biosynthesis
MPQEAHIDANHRDVPKRAKPAHISVVIPSRTQPSQLRFLARSIGSIRAQIVGGMEFEIIVGIDRGAAVPELLGLEGVRFIEADARGQAAALNAGAAVARGDYLAFLEDDDEWHPQKTAYALRLLEQCDFVSSTQLEVDESGNSLQVNDFPTPSGWLMPMESWHLIGPFDTRYRWHLDNEWLGRLGDSHLRRIHLVEAKTLSEQDVLSRRPHLLQCLRAGGPNVRLCGHPADGPLVRRMTHAQSGMGQIGRDDSIKAEARAEGHRLIDRFRRFPW